MNDDFLEAKELFNEKQINTMEEIGRGKNGTVVYQGSLGCRTVAWKCMEIKYYDNAIQEIKILSKIDYERNIIHCYGHAKDEKFVYIALEQYDLNLEELILAQKKKKHQQDEIKNEVQRKKLQSIKDLCDKKGIELFKKNMIPTDQFLKLMRNILKGICQIHENKIIHGDLRPENILLKFRNDHFRAKICDFNRSRQIEPDQSFKSINIGHKKRKAGEELNEGEKAMERDALDFGCIIFYAMTCGNHPFGNISARENNIKNGNYDISAISHIPEAYNLVERLLRDDERPKLHELKRHPFFGF